MRMAGASVGPRRFAKNTPGSWFMISPIQIGWIWADFSGDTNSMD